MTVRNYPSGLGWTPGAGGSDTGPLNLGTCFNLTAAANVTGVRFNSPNSQTVTGQLWADGAKVAEKTGQSVTSGWNTITFDTPYAATTGVLYVASILLPSGSIQYTTVTNQWTDGTNSVLVTFGPATWNDTANNRFTYGTTVPANSSGATGPWYGIDAVIDDLVSPDGTVNAVAASGSGAMPAPQVSNQTMVGAVKATGAGSFQPPTVTGETVLSGGGPATGSGLFRPPTVSGGTTSATVTAVCAIGSGLFRPPGVHVSETLPANVSTGRVKARFATAEILVGDNDGIPNLFPVTTETVTFTSTASVLLNSGASPDPIVILPKPIVCSLDSQGYMVDSAGHRWCDLIATDDSDLTPSGRKWTITFSSGLGISSFSINVAAGTTVDLTTLIPT